jgi:ELWxxDGT repeat protein
MKQKLPSIAAQLWFARKAYCTCLLLMLVYGAANSQPTMLYEIPDGSKNFVHIGSSLYYSVSDQLYKASSTSTPVLVKTTGQQILKIYEFTLGSTFFFVTQNGSNQSLWRSDGTAANTAQVTTQLQITPLLTYNSNLFLKINTAAAGNELWKVSGTFSSGIVKDINPGSASGYTGFGGSLIIHNNLLYFFATSSTGQDLWRSDGTTSGTVLSVNLDDTELYLASDFYELTSVNNLMFFTRYHEDSNEGGKIGELWKTDATSAGTVIVQSSSWHSYNFYSNLTAFQGKLYYFHNIGDPIYTHFSVSDGTAAGTRHIDVTTIDGGPRQLINAETHLLFYATSQGNTTPIEKFDGSTVSTLHNFSYYHSTSDENIDLTYTEGQAFFLDDLTDYYGGAGELWQADLATGVTKSLMDRYGVSYYGSRNITAANGSIYFTRALAGGLTLWYYDPDAPPVVSDCGAAGFIEREKWSNVSGYAVSSIPVSRQPNSIDVLGSFTTARNEGDNYGARVRGYVCAPENGNYVFYVSGDDNTELWLSTDEDPANKRLIASSKWTNYNQWDKYTTQQSAEIALVKGGKYYIEALHKEAAGADHLSVGWKLPSGTLERPISGKRLTPFERNIPPTIEILNPAEGATFTAPAMVYFSSFARDTEGRVAKVSYYINGMLFYESSESPYEFEWHSAPQGTYTIEARATDSGGYTTSDFETFTILPGCAATGSIYQEIWANAAGTDVRTFDFSTNPTGSRSFSSFETSQFYGNNYASRMRGYICVPQTGSYTFWISSDDSSELYLSTDDTEANKTLIAWVYGYTSFRDYDKYASQKSVQITLQAGHRYYIEARHKEGTGNDFISVGWQMPDGILERPMAPHRLIAIKPVETTACTGTGTLVREIWTGITGTSVSTIPGSSPPNTTVTLTSFSTPNYYGNDYGSRIRGYVCAPATGAYTFWISGDDNSELWLSDNDNPANKRRIAYVSGATSVNQWDKYSTQMSTTINLVQGQRYYVEVLHKEGNGADHVEVGWRLPSGALERPIPGSRIIPFQDASTSAANFTTDEVFSEERSSISVYPNPVASGKTISITLPDGVSGDIEIDVISATGASLQREKITNNTEGITMDLRPSIVPGIYALQILNNRKRWVTKIQVK